MRAGILVLLCGCVSDVQRVKTRAASDFSCAEREIAIVEAREDISEPTFEITACGHRARYSCHDRHRDVDPRKNVVPGCTLDLEYPSSSSASGAHAKMSGQVDGRPFSVVQATAGHPNDGVVSIFLGEAESACPDLHINGSRSVILIVPWRDGTFDYDQTTLRVSVDHGTSAPFAPVTALAGGVELRRTTASDAHLAADLTWTGGALHGEIDVAACP
jgi:hypothetical protein